MSAWPHVASQISSLQHALCWKLCNLHISEPNSIKWKTIYVYYTEICLETNANRPVTSKPMYSYFLLPKIMVRKVSSHILAAEIWYSNKANRLNKDYVPVNFKVELQLSTTKDSDAFSDIGTGWFADALKNKILNYFNK